MFLYKMPYRRTCMQDTFARAIATIGYLVYNRRTRLVCSAFKIYCIHNKHSLGAIHKGRPQLGGISQKWTREDGGGEGGSRTK